MSSDIETGWLVDKAIEPMNTKLARLTAEEKAEHYQEQAEYYLEQAEHYAVKSKVFVLTGTDSIESSAFLGTELASDSSALASALTSIANSIELVYQSSTIHIAKLVFNEEKSVAQVKALVDEACAAVPGINIKYIEAINSLQPPTI